MSTSPREVKRAADYEDLKPLLDLCRAGKLFEVQEWIAAGKPVNPPPIPTKGRRGKSPLEVSIDTGFHSLVKELLRAGAVIEPDGWDSPMNKVLQMRRFDLVKLLVEYGYDLKTVDMHRVFDSWDPEIMAYFIEHGADVETGKPVAYAFCNRIRTALRVYKQYVERFPSLREQVNIALRHHCKEGNVKWISLMLWAGADPYKPGADTYEAQRYEDDEGLCALGYAALYDHFEVFEMRQIRMNPAQPDVKSFLRYLCKGRGVDILRRLLEKGFNPNDRENGGSSVIHECLIDMGWTYSFNAWNRERQRRSIDTDESRDKIKAVHLLARHGGRWIPADKNEISETRRSLLKLAPDYTVEFIWIMSKYKACTRDAIEELISTPTIKRHVSEHVRRVHEIMSAWR